MSGGQRRVRSYCNDCRKAVRCSHYHGNADVYKKRSVEWRQEVAKEYCRYLLQHPCVDCGQKDIRVLEPDHLHDKVGKVSAMINHGRPWDYILAELAKCAIRCSNCHAIKTAEQQRWMKHLVMIGEVQL